MELWLLGIIRIMIIGIMIMIIGNYWNYWIIIIFGIITNGIIIGIH